MKQPAIGFQTSVSSMLRYLPANDVHPPLYFLLLKPVVAGGGTEWLLRLPSTIASIVSIGLIYCIGNTIFDRRTGLSAALIFAFAPLQIWYAQEARMYSLVLGFTMAACLFAVKSLRSNRWFSWTMLACFQALALWTNSAALWFVLAMNIAALMMSVSLYSSSRLWRWCYSQSLTILLFLPWIPALLQQIGAPGINWIPPASALMLMRTFADLVTSYQRSSAEAIVGIALLLLAFATGFREFILDAYSKRMWYVLLSCLLLVPIGLSFMASQHYIDIPVLSQILKPDRSIFLTRNLIVASFPLYLLMARGLVLADRRARNAMLIGLILLCVVAYQRNALTARKEDLRGAVALIAHSARLEDAIVLAPPYLEKPFRFYFDRNVRTESTLASISDGLVSRAHNHTTLDATLDASTRVWLITTTKHLPAADGRDRCTDRGLGCVNRRLAISWSQGPSIRNSTAK
jgi:mannosyltransferase